MNQIDALEFFNKCAEVKTIAEVNYSDLEKIITDVFIEKFNESLPYYEMVAEEEWGNYQSHSFDLEEECDDWEDIEPQLKIGKWPRFNTRGLLTKLVEMKYIPQCEILIDVYW